MAALGLVGAGLVLAAVAIWIAATGGRVFDLAGFEVTTATRHPVVARQYDAYYEA